MISCTACTLWPYIHLADVLPIGYGITGVVDVVEVADQVPNTSQALIETKYIFAYLVASLKNQRIDGCCGGSHAWVKYVHGTRCWLGLATAGSGTRTEANPDRRSSLSCTQMAGWSLIEFRQRWPQAKEVLYPVHRWQVDRIKNTDSGEPRHKKFSILHTDGRLITYRI